MLLRRGEARGWDIQAVRPNMPEMGVRPDDAVLVASYGDLKYSRRYFPKARRALLQHGSGQSYGGVKYSRGHPSYSGGRDHDDVGLFLVPNEYSGRAWQDAYPPSRVEIVGSPKVQVLPPKATAGTLPVVAISFHWQCSVTEESKSAFPHFRVGLEALAKERRWEVIGHCHPRARRWLQPYFKRYGVEFVETFEEVCQRADVYVIDNSSTMFEFAATGRPVVLMNPPWYRHEVDHGMRFWELASLGPNVQHPSELPAAVELALRDPKGLREERERIVDLVYPVKDSIGASVAALQEWL